MEFGLTSTILRTDMLENINGNQCRHLKNFAAKLVIVYGVGLVYRKRRKEMTFFFVHMPWIKACALSIAS